MAQRTSCADNPPFVVMQEGIHGNGTGAICRAAECICSEFDPGYSSVVHCGDDAWLLDVQTYALAECQHDDIRQDAIRAQADRHGHPPRRSALGAQPRR